MKSELSDEVKKDLANLRIDTDSLDNLTVQMVKIAYYRAAMIVHPDKADRDNPKQVEEFTAAFQELLNGYHRVLQYMIENMEENDEDNLETMKDVPMSDEDLFAKESFEKFNFSQENKGSFTVRVEDKLAEVWQECLEIVYGEPTIIQTPTGTESDRFWKTTFSQAGRDLVITIHFYNHNKPKDKKQSKIMVQGAVQSIICEYVLCDLPKIYKMVSARKPPNVAVLRQSKRKRLTTPVKKRNIKYKPAPKQEIIKCAMCEFTTPNNVKLKKHMKTYHTEQPQPIIRNVAPVPPITESVTTQSSCVQDMSVCVASDSDDEALVEITKCTKCDFEASTEGELERHLDDLHTKITTNTLAEDTVPSDRVKPIPLYKCKECAFAATSTEALTEHKKTEHIIKLSSKTQDEASVFLHSCISCQFRTNDYNELNEHIESSHGKE